MAFDKLKTYRDRFYKYINKADFTAFFGTTFAFTAIFHIASHKTKK